MAFPPLLTCILPTSTLSLSPHEHFLILHIACLRLVRSSGALSFLSSLFSPLPSSSPREGRRYFFFFLLSSGSDSDPSLSLSLHQFVFSDLHLFFVYLYLSTFSLNH